MLRLKIKEGGVVKYGRPVFSPAHLAYDLHLFPHSKIGGYSFEEERIRLKILETDDVRKTDYSI
ncbi:MAG: hypothetical protein Q8O04_01280 [Deltaproteobacteria bacterium]|nr:hypothetical protein [Deltaproteobacteria bacterium]